MAAGFQCWNDGEMLQVDGSYKNMMFLSKTTKSTSSGDSIVDVVGSYFWQNVTHSFNAKNPVVAIRCDYPVVVIASKISTSSPYNCEITLAVRTGGTSTSRSVTFYVYGEQVTSGKNYGLQVFDSSGGLVFDALNKQMKVVGFHSPAGEVYANGNTTAHTYSYPAGKNYAFILSAPMGVGLWVATGEPVRGWVNGVRNSSNNIIVQQVLVYLGSSVGWNLPIGTPAGELDRSITILDVTGL